MSTQRDKDVLNMILNPLMPTKNFNPDEVDKCVEEEGKYELQKWRLLYLDYSHLPNYAQSRQFEIEGIQLSEEKNYTEAIKKFDQAISACPDNPSAYNNRAQQYQLLKQTEGE